MKAYRAFSNGKAPSRTLTPQLLPAEQTFEAAPAAIVALPAPAKHLRALLIQRTDSEVSTAHEIGRLSAYAPQYSALLQQAKTAGAQLSRQLAAVKPPAAHKIRGTKQQVQKAQAEFAAQQADGLDTYVTKVAALKARLRTLRPPPVMTPGQECVDLLGEPRWIPELEAVPLSGRQLLEGSPEPIIVTLERRRQLPENRPHFGAAKQRARGARKTDRVRGRDRLTASPA